MLVRLLLKMLRLGVQVLQADVSLFACGVGYTYMHACIHAYMHAHMHAYIHGIRIYEYVYICNMCLQYAYMYIYIYICTHLNST